MSRMNRRRFTWMATSGIASAALVACGGDAVDEDLTPTQIPDAAGAPPTLAPNATPFSSEEVAGGEQAAAEATPVEAAAGAQTHVVEMTDELVFDPAELTINVGDTVTWRTTGAIPHTSTCDPELAQNPEEHVQLPEGAETWNSGDVAQGEEFSHTFEVAGEYTYFCIPHEAVGMIGYLTVQEGGGEAAAAEEEAAPEETPAEEEAAAGGAEAVDVVATEFAFDPAEFSIPADTDVEIHLINEGALQHDFVIEETDFATELLNGGEETTITVNLPAGEYIYFCSVPGHRESGMEGTLTVE